MKKIPYLLSLTCALLNSGLVLAQTVYVASNGKDSNQGTKNSPFATFAKATSVMTPGGTCIIRKGRYEQELIINKSGTAGNYLTFKAADGEEVTITATTKIKNWSQHKGKIYKTNVAMNLDRLNTVYYREQYMDLARWPNNVDNNRWTVDCKPVKGGNANSFLVDEVPNINWTGGSVYYLGGHSGTSWTRKITNYNNGRITHTGVNINLWPFNPHNPTIRRDKGGRGQLFLFNKLEALDHPREWFYNSETKTLYFQAPNGGIPASGDVEINVRKYTAQIKGQYVKVEGINFFGGAVKIIGANNIFLKNKVIHGNEGHDRFSNTSASTGEAAIEVLGKNTLIKKCLINHSAFNGISIPRNSNPDNTIIEQNSILNTDYLGIHTSPIRTAANNIKVLKNVIKNSGRDGMFVAGKNCEIAYNDVSYAQRINSDSGLFYMVGNNEFKNTEIHHNWFHDATAPSYTEGKAAGIYLDNDSKGVTVHHNVIWNVSWSGYQVNWENRKLDFFHNTIWNAGRAMGSWVNGRTQSNNKIYNNYSNIPDWFRVPAFDIKNNVISSTSPFINANGRNFIPKSNSSVVDKGRVISGFPKVFNGSKPDIGAYELNGTRWTAGIDAIEDTGVSTENNNNDQLIPNGNYFINSTTSNQRLLSRSLESHSARMVNPASFNDQIWVFKHIDNNIYTIKNMGTNRYLEVPFSKCGNGENVATWTGAGNKNQKWEVVKNGANIFGLIPNHCTTVGLDRSQGKIDANVQVWKYSAANNNQKWKIIASSNRNFSKEISIDNKVSLYPNPTKENVTITGIEKGDIITIYDMLGKQIVSTIATNNQEILSILSIKPGIYVLSILGKSKLQFVKK